MSRTKPNVVLGRLHDFLEEYGLRGKVVVAVSGGPDSVCLLQGLHELAEGAGLSLLAAHLNHRLRGGESDADAAYVEHFCRERSLPWVIEALPSGDLTPGQAHLEATARRLRYGWLAGVARREGCGWVLTGHTAGDQAETVLHHLLRGTGWRGLRGIAPERPLTTEVQLARPLLSTTREEVLAFLASRGITARQDQSNDDPAYTRNRIRRVVVPLLEQTVNPHAVRHLASLADRASEVYPAVRRAGRNLLARARLADAGQVLVYDQKALARARDVVLQEALRQLWRQQGWPVTALSAAHWRRVMDVCRGERVAVQLPAGVRVRRRLHVVHFFREV